ncbi:MAG: hypothetical protein IJT21_05785, partial [Synergistaceae bacterium]|nr:hypothetical protein [Synergistaceae bacterium]
QLQAGTGKAPDVLDKIDCDEIIDQLADMYVIPAGIVLGDDAVQAKRDQRQDEQKKLQQMQHGLTALQAGAQAAPQIAGAMKDLAELPNNMAANDQLENMTSMMTGGDVM